MIRRSISIGLITFACFSEAPLVAQEASKANEGAKGNDPSKAKEAEKEGSQPVFYLRDKSKIAGAPKFESLEVNTQYGTLSIPRDQILKIRFARRVAPELKAKIDGHIADLGNEDFDKREAATEALREIGIQALEALRAAARSTSEEVKNRASSLVEEIAKRTPEASPLSDETVPGLSGTDDEVTTIRMTVKGLIPLDQFSIESRYGELKVATADLSGVVFRSTGPQGLKIDIAPSYQPPGNWLDTKFDVEKGQRLKIEASGTVNVRNYGVSSGPDGNRDWGGTTFQNFPMLALVGKIGKRGQAFLIGTNHTSKTKAAGRLYLAVVTFSPNPGGANGSYKVSVQASGGE